MLTHATRLAALVCIIAAATSTSAFAQSKVSMKLNDSRIGTTRTELLAQVAHSQSVISFFTIRHHWMVAPRHSSCLRVPWQTTCRRARAELAAHRWLLDRAQARLLPNHYDGWACITNGAYAGAPHEGNGVNGAYAGPLGMTNPWAGHSGDWVNMEPASVYAIAETVAAKHRFSDSWMRGQWPETYPPCSGYFGAA